MKFWVGGQGIEGTRHLGGSRSNEVGGNTVGAYHRYVRTDFQYNQFRRRYNNEPNGTACDDSGHARVGDVMQTVRSWTAGVNDDAGTGSEAINCNDFRVKDYPHYYKASPTGGSYVSKDRSRATKVGYAVNTGFLRLGNTSGYSTNMKMAWSAVRGTGVYLCGLSGEMTNGTPGIIHAQNS